MRRIDGAAVGAVVRKDPLAVTRSKAVILPMLMVPTLLLVVLPAMIGLGARRSAGRSRPCSTCRSTPATFSWPSC